MPEQLTKHPEVTLQVLRSAGAQCGTFAPQDILKTCPAERFCKLPGGEVCIYGIADAPGMTQFSAADWKALAVVTREGGIDAGIAVAGGMAALVVGIALGILWRR